MQTTKSMWSFISTDYPEEFFLSSLFAAELGSSGSQIPPNHCSKLTGMLPGLLYPSEKAFERLYHNKHVLDSSTSTVV